MRPVLAVVAALAVVASGCAGPLDSPDGTALDRDGEPTTAATPPAVPTSGSGPTRTGAPSFDVTVTDVVDGDTIEIRYANWTTDTVRLLGIDTPEVHHENDPAEFEGVPDTERGAACLREYGSVAGEFVERYEGATVTIRLDEAADTRGYYGRLLAYVHHDGTNLNYRLVAVGYARVYDSQFAARESFEAAEADARDERRGLWLCRGGTATTAGSGTAGSGLVVAAVHADAAGNDHENRNDEYVRFRNDGDRALDISGWTVRDDAGHTYLVPAGTTLPPGGTVTLYTGSGSDTSTRLYWGSDSAVWNNGGDTIVVETDDGRRVVEYSYG